MMVEYLEPGAKEPDLIVMVKLVIDSITEAEAFVRAAWREGDSLDARIQDGRYWDAVFGIAPDGTVYVSPHYATMVARATRVIGKVGQDAN
jgi:hypothetical protein